MCVDFVRVDYQPEGGSHADDIYTVDNTTATSATLPNLQCNTKYTIWVYASGGQIDSTSSQEWFLYQPEGSSLMMYTVDSTTATSATLHNLQCNTKYTVWAHARGGLNDTRSVSILASLPARGMMSVISSIQYTVVSIILPSLPSPL